MNRRTVLATIVVALFLAMPLASADWRGRGFYEPDTSRDRTDGYLYLDEPNVNDGKKRVYLTAFSGFYVLTPNQNSGVLGSAIMTYPTNMHALFGVWRDCNNDGYIGTIEGALFAYRAELLIDTTICPVTAGTPTHNDGAWVREFISIGPDASQAANPHNYNDPDARLWGDWGLPEDAAKASCPVNPRPEGTYRSTGGFLRYSDCFTNWRITGTVNQVAHAAGQPGLAFDDAPYYRPDQSSSPLNQKNPWGSEQDSAAVTVFDCKSTTAVPDPTGQLGDDNGNLAYVRGISGATNSAGSPAGTVNETEEGLPTGDCDRTNDDDSNAEIVYIDEEPFEGALPKREKHDVYYSFTEGSGGSCAFTGALGNVCQAPPGLGVGVLPNFGSPMSHAYWFGAPGYAVSRNPYVNRDDLTPWGGVYYTLYGYTNAASYGGELPQGSALSTYGDYHCDGTAEITGGWVCDPEKWWLGPDGKKMTANPSPDIQVTVGAKYNIRDIDCYDTSAAQAINFINLGLIGKTQCVR